MPARRNDMTTRERHAKARKVARGLGWFSIGLGLAELLMPRTIARGISLQGRERLLQFYGLREIATGVGILMSRQPAPWVWGRVAGDALDLATLGSGLQPSNPRWLQTGLAIAAVGGVTVADVACAEALSAEPLLLTRDYGDRTGLKGPPHEMRGAARTDFETPREFQVPDALRPYTLH
jgi:hypothetical protein